MKELYLHWLALKLADPSIDTVVEQFHLAQAITAHRYPDLYKELQDHRIRCLAILRKNESVPKKRFLGIKYNIVTASSRRLPRWWDIELTPDITFTLSTELVGKILPRHYTVALKKMIRLQVQLIASL